MVCRLVPDSRQYFTYEYIRIPNVSPSGVVGAKLGFRVRPWKDAYHLLMYVRSLMRAQND